MGDHDTYLPLNLTWRVINIDSGKILNQTSHAVSLVTRSPDLYFDLGLCYGWTKVSDVKLQEVTLFMFALDMIEIRHRQKPMGSQ